MRSSFWWKFAAAFFVPLVLGVFELGVREYMQRAVAIPSAPQLQDGRPAAVGLTIPQISPTSCTDPSAPRAVPPEVVPVPALPQVGVTVGPDNVIIPQNGNDVEEGVRATVAAWRRAFVDCDSDALVNLYWFDAHIVRFTTHRGRTGEWVQRPHRLTVEELRDRIARMCISHRFDVTLGPLHFYEPSAARRNVDFRQRFQSFTTEGGLVYSDDGRKYLIFEQRHGEWRIRAESWRAFEVPPRDLPDEPLPARR